jgi:cytochrome c oxidase subunit 1
MGAPHVHDRHGHDGDRRILDAQRWPIAVPTGVKIFNWIGTPVGRATADAHADDVRARLRLRCSRWAASPASCTPPLRQTLSSRTRYFVVAHFHYVLIGGSIFALLAGIHYWFPLIFGRKVSEARGKASFWVIFVGFNVTFFPMHFLGLNGMPRRTFTYDGNMGWNSANFIASVGAMILGIGMAVYFVVMLYTYFKGEKVGRDPWGARTLEWSIPNPPPEYEFRRDSHGPRPRRLLVREASPRADRAGETQHAAAEAPRRIHMPSQVIVPDLGGHGHADRPG